MVVQGGVDECGDVVPYPQALHSGDMFEEWFFQVIASIAFVSTWLSTRAKYHAKFLRDYPLTVDISLESVPVSDSRI